MRSQHHDVVICTRNRPQELAACLSSLSRQTRPADVVRVVDASDAVQAAAVEAVVDAARRRSPGLDVVMRHTSPSTSAQRNLGVRESTADVIHFLDDDAILEEDYLERILSVFEVREQREVSPILGVGGQPTNLPSCDPGRLRRLLASCSNRPGAVLRSGRGILACGLTERTDVDWLSGCCMSFRRSVLLDEPFDETIDGYVLGEDLDVGYRVRQHGRLVVEPAARLVHLESPLNRWDRRRWASVDIVNRRRRVATGVGHYSAMWFWVDTLAQLLLWSLRSVRAGASGPRATALGIVDGLIACMRQGWRSAA